MFHIEGCILISSENRFYSAEDFTTIILLHLQEMEEIFKVS